MTDQPLIVGPRGEALEATISEQATDIFQSIARAVKDPACDVEKMAKLLELRQIILAEQREISFKAALGRLQAVLPMVTKDGRIIGRDGHERRYARRETIHHAIQPLLAAEGFSLTFTEEEAIPPAGGLAMRRFSCTLSHRDGHSVKLQKTLPLDSHQSRNAVQSEGSTTTYAQRYLTKMVLNIVERDEDDDGMGGSQPISKDEALNIYALLDEVRPPDVDKERYMKRFLKLMDVEHVEDILQRNYKKAVTALEAKRKSVL